MHFSHHLAPSSGRRGFELQDEEESDDYQRTLQKLEGLLSDRAKNYEAADIRVPLGKSASGGEVNVGAAAAVITNRRAQLQMSVAF